MDIKPIKTETDYRSALKDIEGLMMAEADTPEGDRLDVLATLVEAYERQHYAIDAPSPIEAIKFRMEQRGLRPSDVTSIFGQVNRYYEVMSGTRSLSIAMIRKLHDSLGIPYESLLGETRARAA